MRKYVDNFLMRVETNSEQGRGRKRHREASPPSAMTHFPVGTLSPVENVVASFHSQQGAINENATLFAKKYFWSWKSGGTKRLIVCLISLFSYSSARLDMTNILHEFSAVLASALNEKILNIAAGRVERKPDRHAPVREDMSGFSGVRTYGTPLECALEKLMEIVRSVECSEKNAKCREIPGTINGSIEGDKNATRVKGRSTLYGTGSLLTFEDERNDIYKLLGVMSE